MKGTGWTTAEQSPQEGEWGRKQRAYREGPATSAGGGGFTFSIAWTKVYTALIWKQWWMRTYSPELLNRWLNSGDSAAKSSRHVWQTPLSRQGWGPLESTLGGTQTWALRGGRPSEGERIATVGVKDKQERAAQGQGDWARGCPRQECRGGRPCK